MNPVRPCETSSDRQLTPAACRASSRSLSVAPGWRARQEGRHSWSWRAAGKQALHDDSICGKNSSGVDGVGTGYWGQFCLRRAKAIGAADLQQKVLRGMQQQHLQGGNCCSDLTVRRAGLCARPMLNGWREAGVCPRRISESKKGGELFRPVSSGCLAC